MRPTKPWRKKLTIGSIFTGDVVEGAVWLVTGELINHLLQVVPVSRWKAFG